MNHSDKALDLAWAYKGLNSSGDLLPRFIEFCAGIISNRTSPWDKDACIAAIVGGCQDKFGIKPRPENLAEMSKFAEGLFDIYQGDAMHYSWSHPQIRQLARAIEFFYWKLYSPNFRITSNQAARRHGCLPRFIVAEIKRSHLKAEKVGRDWLIEADEFQRWQHSKRRRTKE